MHVQIPLEPTSFLAGVSSVRNENKLVFQMSEDGSDDELLSSLLCLGITIIKLNKCNYRAIDQRAYGTRMYASMLFIHIDCLRLIQAF